MSIEGQPSSISTTKPSKFLAWVFLADDRRLNLDNDDDRTITILWNYQVATSPQFDGSHCAWVKLILSLADIFMYVVLCFHLFTSSIQGPLSNTS